MGEAGAQGNLKFGQVLRGGHLYGSARSSAGDKNISTVAVARFGVKI